MALDHAFNRALNAAIWKQRLFYARRLRAYMKRLKFEQKKNRSPHRTCRLRSEDSDPENRAFIYPRQYYFLSEAIPKHPVIRESLLFKEVINETPIISNCFPAMFISISNVCIRYTARRMEMENIEMRTINPDTKEAATDEKIRA